MGILVHVPFVLPDALSGPQVPQLDLWEEAQRLSGRVQQVLVSPRQESQRGRGGFHRPLQVRKSKLPYSKSENPSEAPGPVPRPFRLDEALSRWQSSCPAHLAPRLASTCLSPAAVRRESLLPSPSPGPEQLLGWRVSGTRTVPAMSDAIRHCSSWRICTEVTAESWNRRVAFQPLP